MQTKTLALRARICPTTVAGSYTGYWAISLYILGRWTRLSARFESFEAAQAALDKWLPNEYQLED